ncbi:CheR family methyltransferase [Tropicibacter naphthalenivorans]|uniref:Chemotaxis protein methyltransferase n=1 Tax=Tropicibacter naphthalenivorans TaxID=441103 RepID=A0A0P1GK96_9RHOB|nr:protein-glutamate O-methyltransferase [Tropicibacter naphthalenivorans]CUH82422.1 Chemotaxis protein methyltransferase [Tropicibacter naphthalenivorans]SMD06294.1 chemotaxis protein methyltransferase CheR [Tropicibacter naphthalenivorans]
MAMPDSESRFDIPFSDKDFQSLAALAKENYGLSLSESKKPLVYSRLSKRLKARKVSSFQQYIDLVRSDPKTEAQELVSALTTNVTSFFREPHHFKTLAEVCLPQFQENAKHGDRSRVWSAGCSSGEEPYSIAATILEKMPQAAECDVKILATDIDPKVLEVAKRGQYSQSETETLDAHQVKALFASSKLNKDRNEICAKTKSLISFAELNLISEWPIRGRFDAIFCRNVAIYFDQQTQQNLWMKLTEKLKPGGHLFIGHSERITGPAGEYLINAGVTSYKKRQDA